MNIFKSQSCLKCRIKNTLLNKTRKNSNYKEQYSNVDSVCMSEHLQKSYWTEIYEKSKPILIKGLVNNWRAVSDDQLKWITGIFIYVFIYEDLFLYTYMCIFICVYLWVYTFIHVFIYMFIHTYIHYRC
jgi:hypothetical protein